MDEQKRIAEEMIEDGIALVARGMFRKGAKGEGNDPNEAYKSGMSAVSVIRGMAFDFKRLAKQE